MMTINYDTLPIGFTDDDFAELKRNEWVCLSIIAENFRIITIIEKIKKFYNNKEFSILIKTNNDIMKDVKPEIEGSEYYFYPEKINKIVFSPSELLVINSSKFINYVINRWGNIGWTELLIGNNLAAIEYQKQGLYKKGNRAFINYYLKFECIVRETGDENEMEIILRNKYLANISNEIVDLII